jgi:predicted tellurium resistance membrane protein TerC
MSISNAASVADARATGKGWTRALWVAQVLLAIAFGMAGAMKTFTPIEELAKKLPWVTTLPSLVRFIGVSELAAALGLVLPAAARVRPVLTPIAALGLVVIMVLAAGFHILRGEAQAVPINAVLGGLAALVAWGRLRKAPITARR